MNKILKGVIGVTTFWSFILLTFYKPETVALALFGILIVFITCWIYFVVSEML